MGPSNANAGRGEWFRANMKRPQTIAGMVIGAAVALLAGAYWGGLAGAAAAPIAVLLVIAGVAWWLADRRAEAARRELARLPAVLRPDRAGDDDAAAARR